ncbi:MAG: hypothetical protein Q4P18_07140 [Methanobrevibacter sp.]|nr:hypothetical protein [Methanobrevibacter sp.]MDO5849292.1 hypothetical protein [Methanobrevibacter sp.]
MDDKSKNKKQIKLDIHFNDRRRMELTKKYFNGEITFEEMCKESEKNLKL